MTTVFTPRVIGTRIRPSYNALSAVIPVAYSEATPPWHHDAQSLCVLCRHAAQMGALNVHVAIRTGRLPPQGATT